MNISEKLSLDFRVPSDFTNRYQPILKISWFRLESTYILVTTRKVF